MNCCNNYKMDFQNIKMNDLLVFNHFHNAYDVMFYVVKLHIFRMLLYV